MSKLFHITSSAEKKVVPTMDAYLEDTQELHTDFTNRIAGLEELQTEVLNLEQFIADGSSIPSNVHITSAYTILQACGENPVTVAVESRNDSVSIVSKAIEVYHNTVEAVATFFTVGYARVKGVVNKVKTAYLAWYKDLNIKRDILVPISKKAKGLLAPSLIVWVIYPPLLASMAGIYLGLILPLQLIRALIKRIFTAKNAGKVKELMVKAAGELRALFAKINKKLGGWFAIKFENFKVTIGLGKKKKKEKTKGVKPKKLMKAIDNLPKDSSSLDDLVGETHSTLEVMNKHLNGNSPSNSAIDLALSKASRQLMGLLTSISEIGIWLWKHTVGRTVQTINSVYNSVKGKVS